MGQEIKTFKALGRENRILCLIVEGEPNASDRPDSGLLECFPEAVRYHFDELGQRTLARTEPIAADLRDGKDGKTNARLKIVAGVVGVSFDELRQREKRRRLWRRIRYAFGALALLAAIGATWFTFTIRQIREEDFDAGLRELLNARPDRAAPYLAEAYSLGIDSPTLRFLLPQALRPLEIEWTDLTGHRNNVISVRYSDDGERLATGSVDRTARIWDASGNPVRVLEGHTDTVGDAAFSPDGSRVVTSSTDRTAIVWGFGGNADGNPFGTRGRRCERRFQPRRRACADRQRCRQALGPRYRTAAARVRTPPFVRRASQAPDIQSRWPARRLAGARRHRPGVEYRDR